MVIVLVETGGSLGWWSGPVYWTCRDSTQRNLGYHMWRWFRTNRRNGIVSSNFFFSNRSSCCLSEHKYIWWWFEMISCRYYVGWWGWKVPPRWSRRKCSAKAKVPSGSTKSVVMELRTTFWNAPGFRGLNTIAGTRKTSPSRVPLRLRNPFVNCSFVERNTLFAIDWNITLNVVWWFIL